MSYGDSPDMLDYIDYLEAENERLREENAKLETQLTWRPVSEKPEKGRWYLVKTTNFIFKAYFDGEKFIKVVDQKFVGLLATHWLPIPPAPEGDCMKRENDSQAQEKIAVSAEYLRGLEEKAEAYDRLMSGGKKTLKEIANFLQLPVAIQPSRANCVSVFENLPYLGERQWTGHWMYTVCCDFDFTGDWQDSLTLPDGWEEQQ